MKLEICCYNIESIIIALKNGADRIEFCAGQSDGGLTPSYGDLCQLSECQLPIAIHPIVRPRGGDFYYNAFEINSMLEDIKLIKQLNFAGVVFGCLLTDGMLDLVNMTKLVKAADGLAITFHRAFDVCYNPFTTLQQLNDLGIERVLTSGQKQTALEGIGLIKQLHHETQSTIIMPACGVRANNIAHFTEIGLTEIHSSASLTISSPMKFKNENVCMSHAKKDEFIRYAIDGNEVSAMKKTLLSSTC